MTYEKTTHVLCGNAKTYFYMAKIICHTIVNNKRHIITNGLLIEVVLVEI